MLIQATDKRGKPPIPSPAQKGSLCTPRTTMRRAGQTTKAANYSTPRY